MPSVEVSAPVSSVASDRLALGVRCVSPGAGSVGGTVNPASTNVPKYCFEGNLQ